MSSLPAPSKRRIKLRKYPNRRYYDVTRSQHATLAAIHQLVLDGYNVEVTDSKTNEDITAKVLAQIIFEHDPGKLGVFPADLLHQIIRSNAPLVQEFVDKYFSHALSAFLQSQQQFERYLRSALGLENPASPGGNWAQLMLGPLAQAFLVGQTGSSTGDPASRSEARPTEKSPPDDTEPDDLRKEIESLRKQVEALRNGLEQA